MDFSNEVDVETVGDLREFLAGLPADLQLIGRYEGGGFAMAITVETTDQSLTIRFP